MHKLFEEGIPIWIDYKPEIAHNRILIMMTTRLLQGRPTSVIQLKKEMLENY